MAEEKIEALRRIYSERARGNFAGGRELLAEDAVISWEVPEGRTGSRGDRTESSLVPQPVESFRTEADEFIELGEQNILVVGRIPRNG